jgi:hypothetical protein
MTPPSASRRTQALGPSRARESNSSRSRDALLAAKPSVPRLALNAEEARAALGVGWHFWREHIAPDLKVIRMGGRKLYSVAELQRWLDEHGERIGL